MAVHHLSGQGDRFIGLQVRILRDDVGHREVGIGLNDAAYDGDIPQCVVDIHHQHHPGCFDPFPHRDKMQYVPGSDVLIDAQQEQHPSVDHRYHIPDQEIDRNIPEEADQDEDHAHEGLRLYDREERPCRRRIELAGGGHIHKL